MLSIRLFGALAVQYAGVPVTLPSRSAGLLLVALLLHAGQPRPRELLSDLLWPNLDADDARADLRHTLWQLRRALPLDPDGREYVRASAAGLAFDNALPHFLDTTALQNCPEETAALGDLAAAVALYTDELLPGYYESWIVLERERLQAVFERKIAVLLDRLVAAGCWPEVVRWAEHWIAHDHAPEPAFRALMMAYAGLQDVGRMVGTYERLRRRLRTEWSGEPSHATRALLAHLQETVVGRLSL